MYTDTRSRGLCMLCVRLCDVYISIHPEDAPLLFFVLRLCEMPPLPLPPLIDAIGAIRSSAYEGLGSKRDREG